jgi:superfamily II DNA/RNA helicase
MSFADLGLHPLVLKSLDSEGYTTPTPVQAASIPPALAGRDILATAATGTGKTAAFLLPAMSRIVATAKFDGAAGSPRLLVLAPTRELATQVTHAVRKHGKFLKLTSSDIVGGMPFRAQLQQTSRPLDIVVATPGRLIDHLKRGRLDLSRVEVLVLDEADRMLDMGFAEDVDLIAKTCAPAHQTMLFTATLDARMSKLAGRLLKNPTRIAVDPAAAPLAIEHRLYQTHHMGHKRRLLNHFVGSSDVTKAIVFVATKRDADRLAEELSRDGHRAAALHGDMDQHQRNHTMHRMRGSDLRLLVATDVAARGIDVRDISHVFNFDLPRSAADYVHRTGRTGRAGAAGIAISFAGAADREIVRNIERLTKSKLAVHVVAGLEAGAMPAVRADMRAPLPAGGQRRHPGGHPGKAHRPFVKTYKDGRPRRTKKRWASQTASR